MLEPVLFISVRAKCSKREQRVRLGVKEQLSCAPVAFCRLSPKGDQRLCMNLDYQWVLMKRPQDLENWTQYSSFVSALFTVLCTINLGKIDVGDYCERVQPAKLPVLTLGSSSVTPGTTCTIVPPLPHPQQDHAGYNKRTKYKIPKFTVASKFYVNQFLNRRYLNPLTPKDYYSGRTAPLTSKLCILYIYSTNIDTKYFKHGINSPFCSLQNSVCFIILTYLVPVLFKFYIQDVLKLKK